GRTAPTPIHEDASTTIFTRSQISRIVSITSASLASSTPASSRRNIANVRGASDARSPSAIVSLASIVCSSPVFIDKYASFAAAGRSEEHTSELQSLRHLVCRLLLEKKKK